MYNFHSLGIETRGKTGGHMKTHCPKCNEQRKNKRDKSLSVDLDRGLGKCHYCGWTFTLNGGEAPRPNSHAGGKKPGCSASLPQHFRRPAFDVNRTQLSDKLTRWLVEERCIPQEVITRMQLTEQEEVMPQTGKRENCLCFNYFENGQLINAKYRDGQKNFKMVAGAELIPYNIDGVKNTPEAVITEGEFDALSLMALGRTDVVSVPSGANRNLSWLDRFVESHFEEKKTIYIATDTDRKGMELRDELVRRLGAEHCRIVGYGPGCKDANEHLKRYGLESLRICLQQAEEIPLEGVFTASDLQDDLHTLYENGFGPGADTGLENLDALCTFELGRLLIVTGIPGSGKSEFTDELVLRLCLRHDWRIAFFSPENMPIVYHLRKLAEKLTGRRFIPFCTPEALYWKASAWLSECVCHILPKENFTIDTVLEKARELVHRRGIRVLVIDPLNRLEHTIPQGQTETQYISSLLNRLSGFAVRHRCLVVLVAHPRKMNRHPMTGVTPRPDLYDINGSAEFFNKCDFGLVVERDLENSLVRLHVEKVKFKHLGQPGPVTFQYDVVNGRYHPCRTEAAENGSPSALRVVDTRFDNECHLTEEATQGEIFPKE